MSTERTTWDLLDEMPALPSDIFEAFEFYKNKGKLNEWNAALAEHIFKENEAYAADILAYCLRRKAEWDGENTKSDALTSKRLKKEMKRAEVRWDESIKRQKELGY